MVDWLSKQPGDASLSADEAADRLIAEGNRAEDAGELLQACELYRRAAALASRYPKAHINLGIGLEAMGDMAGAIGSYEQALACDPVNPAANYNLGKLLYARGELPHDARNRPRVRSDDRGQQLVLNEREHRGAAAPDRVAEADAAAAAPIGQLDDRQLERIELLDGVAARRIDRHPDQPGLGAHDR